MKICFPRFSFIPRLPRSVFARRLSTLLFCLFACVAAALAQNVEPWTLRRQSRQAQLDYVAELKRRLASEPDNPATELDLGRASYQLALDNDTRALLETEQIFKSITARRPDHPTALAYHGATLGLMIGVNLVDRRQTLDLAQTAAAEIDRAVALAPDDVEIRELRGYLSFYTPSIFGRDRVAIEDFTRVIRLLEASSGAEAHRAKTYLILGDVYRKIGDQEQAAANWARVRELLPNSNLAEAASARLEARGPALALPVSNIREIAAFFGFLTGVVVFTFLASLVLRDLRELSRRKRGMIAALAVSLAGLCWNGLHLALGIRQSLGGEIPAALAPLAYWQTRTGALLLLLSPIPVGLLAAYRLYKAPFMDLVLKRGAALAGVFLLALAYGQLIEERLVIALVRVSNPALRSIFFVLALGALLAVYPPLRDAIYRAVDRYLFKRRDYTRLLDEIGGRLRGNADEASLLASGCEAVREAFAADFARFVPASDPLAAQLAQIADEERTSVLLRHRIADEELEKKLAALRIELIVAIRAATETLGVVCVGERAYGQSYLSEELSVLRTMAAETGRAMENLRLHEARRRQAIEEEELRNLLAQSELMALRAQINPHFFFNALNSVASLINDAPRRAEDLLENLAELFRHAFKPSSEIITLAQELELVETYLAVESVRLGDKLRFRNFTLAETREVKIPALTIQPLIENAIRHGIGRQSEGGQITLSASLRADHLHVSVADTGVGIPPAAMPDLLTRGVGLSNVNQRLLKLYGPPARLRIDSAPGQGTTVSFSIPAPHPANSA